jgi:O-antigen ligase
MGIVTLELLALVFIIRSTGTSRIKALAAVTAVICFGLLFISPEQRARYMTIFETADNTTVTTGGELAAIGSAEARQSLIMESIALTLSHPLFGVGPGTFQVAQAAESEARGERGSWHETHNAFTQVSSEAGLPAFIFFTGALVGAMRLSRRVYKNGHKQDGLTEAGSTAFCLGLSLFVFAVTGCFLSTAYTIYLPTLAGLSVALRNAEQFERSALVPMAAGEPRGQRSAASAQFGRRLPVRV